MMAYRYANIKKDLHGIVFKGRLAYAMARLEGAASRLSAQRFHWNAAGALMDYPDASRARGTVSLVAECFVNLRRSPTTDPS